MPVFKTDTIDINYEITGSGEPLVLIGGLGFCRWFWHRIVPELSKDFQVIAFDNRGSGGSSKPVGPYTVPMMAKDTLALLDGLNIRSCYLVGHSLGSLIAQDVAISRPSLVKKLVLAGSTFGGPKGIPMSAETLQTMMNRTGSVSEIIRRGIEVAAGPGFLSRQPEWEGELTRYRMTDPVPPLAYQAQLLAGAAYAGLTEQQVNQRMAAITAPTLLLAGEFDRVVPTANAPLMAQKIRNSRVQVIPGAGHIFPLEEPAATVSAIVRFVRDQA